MVNNYDLIKPFLIFDSEDDFYYLQVLQRKKENRQLGSNSRVIKTYLIGSTEYFDNRFEEITKLCDVFNARAMINLNKRSFYKTAFKSMENVAGIMANKHFSKIYKAYDSACGQGHNDSVKKWIIDVDCAYSTIKYNELYIRIKSLGGDVLGVLPSNSGFHIITTPFRLDLFKQDFPDIDIQKNNPTNLYIP